MNIFSKKDKPNKRNSIRTSGQSNSKSSVDKNKENDSDINQKGS